MCVVKVSPESVEKLEIMSPIILGVEIDSKTCILDIGYCLITIITLNLPQIHNKKVIATE